MKSDLFDSQIKSLVGDEPLHLIIDTWTKPYSNESYIGILIRTFGNGTTPPQDWAIACSPHGGSTSAAELSVLVRKVLIERGFPNGIRCITTNNAANALAIARSLNADSDGCDAHKVNLCVKYAWLNCASIWQRLIRDPLTTFMRKSSTLGVNWKKHIEDEHKHAVLQPLDWNVTRWQGIYETLRRFRILTSNQCCVPFLSPDFTDDDFYALECMEALLSPLAELMVALTQESVEGMKVETSCHYGPHYRYIFQCIWSLCGLGVQLKFGTLPQEHEQALVNFCHDVLLALKNRFFPPANPLIQASFALAMGPILKVGLVYDTEKDIINTFLKSSIYDCAVDPKFIHEINSEDIETAEEKVTAHDKEPEMKEFDSPALAPVSASPVVSVAPSPLKGPSTTNDSGSAPTRKRGRPKMTKATKPTGASSTPSQSTASPTDAVADEMSSSLPAPPLPVPDSAPSSSSAPVRPVWSDFTFKSWLHSITREFFAIWEQWNDRDAQDNCLLRYLASDTDTDSNTAPICEKTVETPYEGRSRTRAKPLSWIRTDFEYSPSHSLHQELQAFRVIQSTSTYIPSALAWCETDAAARFPKITAFIKSTHSVALTSASAENLFSVAMLNSDSLATNLRPGEFETRVLVSYNRSNEERSEWLSTFGLAQYEWDLLTQTAYLLHKERVTGIKLTPSGRSNTAPAREARTEYAAKRRTSPPPVAYSPSNSTPTKDKKRIRPVSPLDLPNKRATPMGPPKEAQP